MNQRALNIRLLLGGLLGAVALAGCGGGQAKVGDCIDSQKNVVDCHSANASMKLVSNQSGPNAIACVQIGAQPELQVKIGSTTFCAESVSASH